MGLINTLLNIYATIDNIKRRSEQDRMQVEDRNLGKYINEVRGRKLADIGYIPKREEAVNPSTQQPWQPEKAGKYYSTQAQALMPFFSMDQKIDLAQVKSRPKKGKSAMEMWKDRAQKLDQALKEFGKMPTSEQYKVVSDSIGRAEYWAKKIGSDEALQSLEKTKQLIKQKGVEYGWEKQSINQNVDKVGGKFGF